MVAVANAMPDRWWLRSLAAADAAQAAAVEAVLAGEASTATLPAATAIRLLRTLDADTAAAAAVGERRVSVLQMLDDATAAATAAAATPVPGLPAFAAPSRSRMEVLDALAQRQRVSISEAELIFGARPSSEHPVLFSMLWGLVAAGQLHQMVSFAARRVAVVDAAALVPLASEHYVKVLQSLDAATEPDAVAFLSEARARSGAMPSSTAANDAVLAAAAGWPSAERALAAQLAFRCSAPLELTAPLLVNGDQDTIIDGLATGRTAPDVSAFLVECLRIDSVDGVAPNQLPHLFGRHRALWSVEFLVRFLDRIYSDPDLVEVSGVVVLLSPMFSGRSPFPDPDVLGEALTLVAPETLRGLGGDLDAFFKKRSPRYVPGFTHPPKLSTPAGQRLAAAVADVVDFDAARDAAEVHAAAEVVLAVQLAAAFESACPPLSDAEVAVAFGLFPSFEGSLDELIASARALAALPA